MANLTDLPLVLLVLSMLALALSERLGWRFSKNIAAVHEDFGVVLTATLTLLGLILGFTFSMAVSRYDQRKHCEAEEAGAIGTEYLRTELLPPGQCARLKTLLSQYVDQRILFYETHNQQTAQRIDRSTEQLEAEMWASLTSPPLTQSTAVIALVVSGMNDVLNSRSYTQAAWLNRIPLAAWALLMLIALVGIFMVGLYLRGIHSSSTLIFILPAILSLSFFLIADIDAPRGGLIHVQPVNLISVARTLRADHHSPSATSLVPFQDQPAR